jgi:hypothetical protein
MWHVVTGSVPFPRFSRQQFEEQVVGQDLRPPAEAVLRANGQSSTPSPQVAPLVALMQSCWAADFRQRPDMVEVLGVLTALLEEETSLHLASGACC